MLKVRLSNVEGAEEGLYAIRDIAKGEIVAFYNGVNKGIVIHAPINVLLRSAYRRSMDQKRIGKHLDTRFLLTRMNNGVKELIFQVSSSTLKTTVQLLATKSITILSTTAQNGSLSILAMA